MQIAIAQELTGVPQFRTQSFFTAYMEGWGLYAERLAKEMGAYEDPYSDFGRLGARSGARSGSLSIPACTRNSGRRSTPSQYFIANSPNAEGQARAEIRRYIVHRRANNGLQDRHARDTGAARKRPGALGDKFDIRGFHDAVLGGGALPLAILERRVNDWVAAQ